MAARRGRVGPMREEVHRLACAMVAAGEYPATAALAARLKLTTGAIQHHRGALVRAGLWPCPVIGRGHNPSRQGMEHTVSRVLEAAEALVAQGEQPDVATIAADLDLAYSTVAKHRAALVKNGRLRRWPRVRSGPKPSAQRRQPRQAVQQLPLLHKGAPWPPWWREVIPALLGPDARTAIIRQWRREFRQIRRAIHDHAGD